MKPTYKELETALREVAKVLPELVETAGFGDECEKLVTQAVTRFEADSPSSMNHLFDFDNDELLDMYVLERDAEFRQELLRRMQDAAETHCRMGVACPLHDNQVHGQEASELRKKLESFLEEDIYSIDETTIDVIGPVKEALQKILDGVDARDSLAFEEQNTDWENPIVTQPGENLIDKVNESRVAVKLSEEETRTLWEILERSPIPPNEKLVKLFKRYGLPESKARAADLDEDHGLGIFDTQGDVPLSNYTPAKTSAFEDGQEVAKKLVNLSDQALLYRFMNPQADEQFTPAERARIQDIINKGVASFNSDKSEWKVTGVERVEPSNSVEGRLKKLEHQFEALEVLYKAQVQNSRKLDQLYQSYSENIPIISEHFSQLFHRTDSLNANHDDLTRFATRKLHKIFYGHNRRHLQAPPKELAPGWARRRAQDVRSWAKSRQTAKLRGCK